MPSCDECRAIARDLWEAIAVLPAGQKGESLAPNQIAEWIDGLDADDCGRNRVTSNLWKIWRRREEHRVLTGHTPSLLPLPPDAIANPN